MVRRLRAEEAVWRTPSKRLSLSDDSGWEQIVERFFSLHETATSRA
jgi:hypothetical protein